MKSCPLRSVRRQRANGAFTLIELLAVMAIILVLAGLIINIAGNANYNSAKARATTEIKAMETALESYKSDNGAYPSEPDPATTNTSTPGAVTEKLNPLTVYDPSDYIHACEFLYQALTGQQITAGATTVTVTKSYISFTPQQLHAAANAPSGTAASPTSPYMYIIDPFGFSYGYSTMNAVVSSQSSATPAPTPAGYNPTFDLWSTAGYATKGGKKTPTTMQGSSTADKYSTLWIKNW